MATSFAKSSKENQITPTGDQLNATNLLAIASMDGNLNNKETFTVVGKGSTTYTNSNKCPKNNEFKLFKINKSKINIYDGSVNLQDISMLTHKDLLAIPGTDVYKLPFARGKISVEKQTKQPTIIVKNLNDKSRSRPVASWVKHAKTCALHPEKILPPTQKMMKSASRLALTKKVNHLRSM